MIKLANTCPEITIDNIESFKIASDYKIYPETTMIYTTESGGVAGISPGGDCVLQGEFLKDELQEFLNLLNPRSIFCGENNSDGINLKGYKKEKVCVVKTVATGDENAKPQDIKSEEAYAFFSSEKNFLLPTYENFAVDYCRRKNHGGLVAAKHENSAMALAFILEDTALICGVVSKKKGYGSIVLKELLSILGGKTVFAAVKEELLPFYAKNNFLLCGNAAYFIKL